MNFFSFCFVLQRSLSFVSEYVISFGKPAPALNTRRYLPDLLSFGLIIIDKCASFICGGYAVYFVGFYCV